MCISVKYSNYAMCSHAIDAAALAGGDAQWMHGSINGKNKIIGMKLILMQFTQCR